MMNKKAVAPRPVLRRAKAVLFAGLMLLVSAILGGCVGARMDTRASVNQMSRELPRSWAVSEPDTTAPLSTHFLALIDDDHLRALVEEGLESNPDLRAAARRLDASQRLLVATGAVRWPSVEAGYAPTRGNQAFDDLGERKTETRHRVSLLTAWELDVWGRLANVRDEQAAFTASEAAGVAAARDALGARIIQTWVLTTSLRQALSVENERVAVLTQLKETIQRRYRLGIGTLDDLAGARASTELACATMVILRDEHDRTVRALELLLGRPPQANLLTENTLPTVKQVSPGYPVAVLARRHDVAAALWRLEAADAGVSAAAKAMLPSLRLIGDASWDDTSLGDLFDATSIWSIAGSLTQPLFQAGALRARAEARKLELEAAWEDYRGAVLRAVGEVEDGLGRERALVAQRDHLVSALEASMRNTQIHEERYRRGIANITELLLARNQEMDIRRQVLAADGDILSNRIALALAVGAGFESSSL